MLYEKVKTIEEISKIVILTDSKEIKDHVNLFNAVVADLLAIKLLSPPTPRPPPSER